MCTLWDEYTLPEGKSKECKIKEVTLVPNFQADVQRSR